MYYPIISMITPFDNNRGNLRQRLRQSQFALGMPPPVFNLHVQKSVQAHASLAMGCRDFHPLPASPACQRNGFLGISLWLASLFISYRCESQ